MAEPEVTDTAAVPGTAAWWRRRSAQEARRRPRSDGLTMSRIIAAALKVIDEEGLEALTMRRLADELGAGAASLYRHVATRDELLVEIVDRVLGEIRADPDARSWRESAWWLAHEVRRVLAAHPSLVQLVPTDRLLGPNARRLREMGLRNLLENDFAPADATQVYAILTGWILGYSVLSTSVRPADGPGAESYGTVEPDRWSAAREPAPTGTQGADGLFELGLRTLLDGIEARYGAEPGPAVEADAPDVSGTTA